MKRKPRAAPRCPIRRILVAVKDPKARSIPVVLKAAQLANALGADLHLFHAISSQLTVDVHALDNGLCDIENDIGNGYVSQLKRIAAKLKTSGIDVTVAARW